MSKQKLNLETPWPEVKEKIKEVNYDLTDADLMLEPGKEDELISRLAKKMHKTEEEVKGWIESVAHTKNRAS
ncbi:general stress protein CsbD [Terrimonas sp. NA20]|uniref:General stress protein CsbD n=1 Tax=Terrimonas ginsenosidimutans TaxID=2908004 RepID=A0ABS9KLA4_9BACT|nr:general stress protein CsbD [Terrimonas ginsenosidimutans]MCG2613091.1 general stress protein CsbD [Terrimonas ginsenosidimutans]